MTESARSPSRPGMWASRGPPVDRASRLSPSGLLIRRARRAVLPTAGMVPDGRARNSLYVFSPLLHYRRRMIAQPVVSSEPSTKGLAPAA